MTIEFRPRLTREYILSRVSEEEIFEKYGIPVQAGNFKSPLRIDRSPTCRFYRSRKSNRLFLHDWAGYFHGDCFDVVSLLPGMTDFNKVLTRVATDFGIIAGDTNGQRIPLIHSVKIEQENCEIRIKRRSWNEADKDFWLRWDFQKATLEYYGVSPVERVWVDNELVYTYLRKLDVAYAYYFGNYDYKIYLPRRDKGRFLQNNSYIIQGYAQLPEKGEFCIITKSLKDVMKFYEYGIPAIAPMSETLSFSQDIYEDLLRRFGRLFLLYDNDMPGKRATLRFITQWPEVCPLLMPPYYPKDFTDFYEERGAENTLALIETVKSQLL